MSTIRHRLITLGTDSRNFNGGLSVFVYSSHRRRSLFRLRWRLCLLVRDGALIAAKVAVIAVVLVVVRGAVRVAGLPSPSVAGA